MDKIVLYLGKKLLPEDNMIHILCGFIILVIAGLIYLVYRLVWASNDMPTIDDIDIPADQRLKMYEIDDINRL